MNMRSWTFLSLTMVAFLGLSACTKGENADAKAFCACVEKLHAGIVDHQCDDDMDKLQAEFRKDTERYAAFKAAARKSCPDEKELIERMK